MADPPQTEAGQAFTDVILEVFRVNGLLMDAGDRLTAPLGLTSARWKVLGAIGLEGRPLTVAMIARRMGLARQSVQRVVNDLEAGGLVYLTSNPDHQRAPLVARTARGERAYADIMRHHVAWSNDLAAHLGTEDLLNTLHGLRRLANRLADGAGEP